MRRAGRRSGDSAQLPLPFDGPPRDGVALHERLVSYGLRGYDRVILTSNATVMVSFGAGALRVHRAYLDAPAEVHRAIVTFACARLRRDRAAARRMIVAHAPVPPGSTRQRRRELPHAADQPLVEELERWHRHYNALHFGGTLGEVPIRVSRRMRSRLGQYAAPSPCGRGSEITISRWHIRRHGWTEALHTLLHEMVHQWQQEHGHPLDHGRLFRAKAREVGISARAAREVGAVSRFGDVPG